jgi:hypothetical protein
MPFSISNVSTVATMIILPMVVAMMAMTIANVRGNESGTASGREHGGAARNKTVFWGPSIRSVVLLFDFVARQAYPAVSFQFERMIPEGNPKEKGNRDCYRALRAQIRIPVLELLDAQLLCGRDNPGSTPGEDIARAAHVGPPVGTGDAPRSAFPLAEQSRPDCFRAEACPG